MRLRTPRIQTLLCCVLLASSGCLRLMEPEDQTERINPDLGTYEERCDATTCGPYACDRSECRTECSTHNHCAAGARCDDGQCIDTTCTADNAAERCGPYACDDGRCTSLCTSRSDCAPGYACEEYTNDCVVACTSLDDPMCEGFACDLVTGRCKDDCSNNSDCAGGFECNEFLGCKPVCTTAWDSACAGLACDLQTMQCLLYCSDNGDCASGYLCDADLECVRDPNATTCSDSEDGACFPYACNVESSLCGNRCIGDADCATGTVCVDHSCKPVCYEQSDPVCEGGACDLSTHSCQADCSASRACAAGFECQLSDESSPFASYVCVESAIQTACTSDAECAPFACGGNGLCFSSCSTADACSAGNTCDLFNHCGIGCDYASEEAVCGAYRCLPEVPAICGTSCEDNSDCQSTYRCVDKECVETAACDGSSPDAVCAPYACDLEAGRCFAQCTDSDQCSSVGYVYCGGGGSGSCG